MALFEEQSSHGQEQTPDAPTRGKKRTGDAQLDFELQFFEAVLERQPDHVDALRVHADNLTARGLFARGLDADRRVVQLRPKDPVAHYNLACSFALLDQTDAAVASLESSLRLGYHDFEHMLSDPDLKHLREDARFLGMLGRHLKRLKRASNPT